MKRRLMNFHLLLTFVAMSHSIMVDTALAVPSPELPLPAVERLGGTITINSVLPQDPKCNGDCNGVITVGATGGTPPLEYSLNGGPYQFSPTFSGLCPGNYNVQVRDALLCVEVYSGNPVVLADPPPIIVNSVTHTDVICNGDCDGTLTIDATGGVPPFTYDLTPSPGQQASNVFTGLCPDSYIAGFSDANGCIVLHPVVQDITEFPPLVYDNVTINDPTCDGDSDGSIVVDVSGGQGIYFYRLNAGSWQPSNTFTNLPAGCYNIEVQDGAGCLKPYPGNPVCLVDPNLTISGVTANDVNCNGACDGQIVINASSGNGGLQYSIDGGSGFQGSNTFAVCPGSYNIVVEDGNGCQIAWPGNPVVITEPLALVYTGVGSTDAKCFGSSDGSIAIQVSGGVPPYEYSCDNGATYSLIQFCFGLSAGNYDVVVRDANGCTISWSGNPMVIGEPTPLVIDNITVDDVTCPAFDDGKITIDASGGTPPYQYELNMSGSPVVDNFFDGLANVSYDVTVIDANGCTVNSGVIAVNEPPPIVITPAITDATCAGGCDGSITVNVSGGTSPYLYEVDGGGLQAGNIFNGLCEGSHTLTVEDANGCVATANANIGFVNTLPVADYTMSANPVCPWTMVSFTDNSSGNTPLSYSWLFGDNGADPTTPSPDHTFILSGIHDITLTVTDVNGCQSSTTQQIEVFNGPNPSFTLSTNPVCQWQPVTFNNTTTGTGPFTYFWDFDETIGLGNPVTSTDEHPTISFNVSGLHNVSLTVTDANGCSRTITQIVNVSGAAFAPFNVPSGILCTNSPINFSPNIYGNPPGWTWLWEFGDFNTSTQKNTTHTYANAGTYTVTLTVTTPAGCSYSSSKSVTINQTPWVSFNMTPDPACEGESVDLNGFAPSTVNSYLWDINTSFCCGGQMTTQPFNTPGPNSVTLNVTDINGCTNSMTQTLTVNPLPQPDFTMSPNPACVGEPVTFTDLTPGASSNIFWDFGDNQWGLGATIDHTYTTGDEYDVTLYITDANNCQATYTQTLTINDPPPLSLTMPNTEFCPDDPCVALNLLPLGDAVASGPGVSPFLGFYQFCPAAAGVGTHTIDYSNTDPVTGCTSTGSIQVTVRPAPEADFMVIAPPNCVDDPICLANGSAGFGTLTYSWDFDGTASSTAVTPCPVFSTGGGHTIELTVTDGFGCQDVMTQSILVEPEVELGEEIIICEGEKAFLSTPLLPGYTYKWYQCTFKLLGGVIVAEKCIGIPNASDNFLVVSPNVTRFYRVCVSSPSGCMACDEVKVRVLRKGEALWYTHCLDGAKRVRGKQDPEAVETTATDRLSMEIFPNPHTGRFAIDLSGEGTVDDLILYDALGQEAYVATGLASGTTSLDISHLPKGIYILKVVSGDQHISRRVVHQ